MIVYLSCVACTSINEKSHFVIILCNYTWHVDSSVGTCGLKEFMIWLRIRYEIWVLYNFTRLLCRYGSYKIHSTIRCRKLNSAGRLMCLAFWIRRITATNKIVFIKIQRHFWGFILWQIMEKLVLLYAFHYVRKTRKHFYQKNRQKWAGGTGKTF